MSNGALLLLENMRYLLWVDHGQDREKWVKVVMAGLIAAILRLLRLFPATPIGLNSLESWKPCS